MDIRRATEDDVLGMQWVARMTHKQVYDDLLNEATRTRLFEERYSEEALAERLADNAIGVFVAIARDSIAGFAICGPTDTENVGELMDLHVDPGFWRRGIGEALLTAVEEYLDERGFERVRTFVIAGNTPGNAFAGARFEQTGQWQSEDGVTYNVYRRTIQPAAGDERGSEAGEVWR